MTRGLSGSSAIANRRGIAFISAAMALFVSNDMLMKKLSESVPMMQLIFVRGLIATTVILVVLLSTSSRKSVLKVTDPRVIVRSLFDSLGSVLYLISLAHLALANATAINLASPLMIAVIAGVLFGERIGPTRWLAIAVGFSGVLLIAQPAAAGFSQWSWVCLVATLGQASRDLMTRSISPAVPSLVITLGNAILVTLFSGVWAGTSAWQPMNWGQLGLVALAAMLLSTAYLLIIKAMRTGDMSVTAPFRYAGLLTALLLGWVVWQQVPNTLATIGIVLVMFRPVSAARAT